MCILAIIYVTFDLIFRMNHSCTLVEKEILLGIQIIICLLICSPICK